MTNKEKGTLTMPSGTHKIDAAAVELGRRGGLARAKKMTAAQRKAAAVKAAKARWKRHKKKDHGGSKE